MAKTGRTWEPTQDGQAVLYGVPGPSYDPEKFSKGYSVLFDAQRAEIAAVFDANCKVRGQRVDQQTEWAVRYFPQEARGQWRVEGAEIVLMYGDNEIARGEVENGRAKLPERYTKFNPAALAEPAAVAA